MASRTALRTLSRASIRSSLPSVAARSSIVAAARAFSVSPLRSAALESDSDLVSALSAELKYEKEAAQEASPEEKELTPASLAKSLKSEGWEVTDKEGGDDVTFTKKIDNEVITVMFSVSDLRTEEPMEEEEAEDMPEPSQMSMATVTVTKPTVNSQALQFECSLQEGQFLIDNVNLFTDSKIALDDSPANEFSKRSLYAGPQFENLDPSVQDHFESYLESRGVDADLAAAIANYQSAKEQKEYVSWLSNVHKFIKE